MISSFQYQQMLLRTQAARRDALPVESGEAVKIEGPLHQQIMDWCNSQWPRVKYIHARMDKKSTIQSGIHDFTLFRNGKAICIECKTKTGKLTEDQSVWAKEMSLQGFTVHVVRSMEQFLEVVKFQGTLLHSPF